jgi:hypothetical protein
VYQPHDSAHNKHQLMTKYKTIYYNGGTKTIYKKKYKRRKILNLQE